ncbi:YHS domain-containing (seleno)protein [Acuticoccus sp. MNP-M23]|uniref:YHS domain-containing (seleno)protein n=1 Tax=Acuticoccus sp. MNP-M23 TaxID=3072793 RepID=UPI002815F897|nr:YHS domain-containing (seleno)protein [Acuticoccus sp. MNP-M23]WMS41877.1 YHS domain-containing (seleno)protein [Acuticoccus sp. MNP-M23]
MTRNSILIAAAFVGAMASAEAAFAADEYNVSTGTTVEGQGVALRGVDAVALAEGLDVTAGHARFTAVHDGVAYYFADEEAMTHFAADPGRYMPRYGGFCAFGVAKGKKLDGDPRYADVVDGKLYLFLNAAVFEAYSQDKAGVLAKAERNWPGMHRRSVAEVNGLETASLR